MMLAFLLCVGVSGQILVDISTAAATNGLVPTVIPNLDLKTRLSVRFVQPLWNFAFCNGQYEQLVIAKNFSLNDTGVTIVNNSDVRSYRNASLVPVALNYFQYTPQIGWTAEGNANYTLLMVDPLLIHGDNPRGPFVVHMAVVNINGSYIASGETVVPFLGAGNPNPTRPNKYTFLLYKQKNHTVVNVTRARMLAGGRSNFNLSSFVSEFELSSPVGINWMYSTADNTTYRMAQDLFGARICNDTTSPDFKAAPVPAPAPPVPAPFELSTINAAAATNGLVPTVIPNLDLKTRLSVRFVQPPWNFAFCNGQYEQLVIAKNFSLNDTGVTIVQNSDVRSYRNASLVPVALNYFQYTPQISWTAEGNANYTLLMVDPLLIHGDNPRGPFVVHMAVVNINGSYIASGETVVPFLGAGNPNPTRPNKYTFLLYKQKNHTVVNVTRARMLAGGRSNFNLSSFVSEFELSSPVGINWMYSTADNTTYRMAQDLFGARICNDTTSPDYKAPAPTTSLSPTSSEISRSASGYQFNTLVSVTLVVISWYSC